MAKIMMCDACKTIFVVPRTIDDDILVRRINNEQPTNCIKVRGRKFDLCDNCLEIFFEWVGCE